MNDVDDIVNSLNCKTVCQKADPVVKNYKSTIGDEIISPKNVDTKKIQLKKPEDDIFHVKKDNEISEWNKAWPRVDEALPGEMNYRNMRSKFYSIHKKNKLITNSFLILQVKCLKLLKQSNRSLF